MTGQLSFLALGGSGEIGMNANLYRYDDEYIMVDLGIGFSGDQYPGIDIILPDMGFIEDRRDKLRAIILTHAHEDHIGGLPYLIETLKAPLYATAFTAALIRKKLMEYGVMDEVTLNIIESDQDFTVGAFTMRFLPIAHSIAEASALLIDTKAGRVFHTGDWKFDDEPQIGSPIDDNRLRAIGDEGILTLVCDSTNALDDGFSGSEASVIEPLNDLVAQSSRRVVITTFASNIARLQTLAKIARDNKRQLCIAGRSLERNIGVAREAGLLFDFPDIIDFDKANNLPAEKVLILATGGQGEPRAALSRMAAGSHRVRLGEGDHVIFSSKKIPGNELSIARIKNALTEQGIQISSDSHFPIHVSGHPSRGELSRLYELLRPEQLIPVHGEARHMMAQRELGLKEGIPKAIYQKNGDLLQLAPDGIRLIEKVETGRLAIDGDSLISASSPAIAERRKLSFSGIIFVILILDGKGRVKEPPHFDNIGVALENEYEADFFRYIGMEVMERYSGKHENPNALAEQVRRLVRRKAEEWTGKKTLVKVRTLIGSE